MGNPTANCQERKKKKSKEFVVSESHWFYNRKPQWTEVEYSLKIVKWLKLLFPGHLMWTCNASYGMNRWYFCLLRLPGTAVMDQDNFLSPLTLQTSHWIPCEANIELCGWLGCLVVENTVSWFAVLLKRFLYSLLESNVLQKSDTASKY